MNCKNCCYYWKEDTEFYAQCHYPENEPSQWAPCEQESKDYRDYLDRIERENIDVQQSDRDRLKVSGNARSRSQLRPERR